MKLYNLPWWNFIFSKLFDSQHVGTPSINEWTVLPWKKLFLHVYSYIFGDWVFSFMGKPLMLFDLAFQMKCKYFIFIKKNCHMLYVLFVKMKYII